MPKCAHLRCIAPGRLLFAVLLGLVLAAPARAVHEESPDVTPVSSGTSHFMSPGRAWSNYVVFSSDQDLAGLGAVRVPGRQIFLFNQVYYDCFHGLTKPTTHCPDPIPPFLRQMTNGPGNPDNPSVGAVDTSGNQWIAFDADGSFNGGTGDSALHRQIFLKNTVTNEVRQITFARNGDSVRPTVSSITLLVAFESTAPLAGFPNPTGVPQIFVYERGSRVLRQISFGSGPSTNPNVSGLVLAFQSSSDILGTGADTGVTQIFYSLYDIKNHISDLRQLTHGNGPSRRPWVSEEGQQIAFESQATNIPGTLGGPGNQIYMTTRVDAPDEPVSIAQLTWPARFGDCSFPVIRDGRNGFERVGFICTGDPLDNGTTGNRAFVLDRQDATLFQITGSGDVVGPIYLNVGVWFMALATTSDLAGTGSCNYQIYVVDYFEGHWAAATQIGQLPQDAGQPPSTSVIGTKDFEFIEGSAAGGSQIAITTLAGSSVGFIEDPRIPQSGDFAMTIGAPDEFTHEASMRVPAVRVKIPPVPMPPESGFGAVCLTAAADGAGVIDCDGGRFGGDIVLTQDHDTTDFDPLCDHPPACREDMSCKAPFPGPHRHDCGICVGSDPLLNVFGTCQGGFNPGLQCLYNVDCYGTAPCTNGSVPVCNGPLISNSTGTFAAGGAYMTLPVHLTLSLGAGVDGVYCTADDNYTEVRDYPLELQLTTSTSNVTIQDADDLLGSTIAVTETGAPFDCNRLRAGDMQGARLVGVLPLLDVLYTPNLHDIVVSVRLEAQPPMQDLCGAPCATSADCDDGNACNGAETCVLGQCAAGTSVVCDDGDPCNGLETCDALTGACMAGTPCNDGNPCNGVETCDAVNGCQTGTPVVCVDDGDVCNGVPACDPGTGLCVNSGPPNCDDGNLCTDDTCDAVLGCVHTPNNAACDDNDLCTTGDACVAGACTGTPVTCPDDGNVCNGVPACDPGTGSCVLGPALDCNDGNVCTDDTCDPVTGCSNTPNAAPCDDLDACTSGDVCSGGTCGGTPISCDDGVFCNGAETCDPEAGCQAGSQPCDDGNPCTDDSCDETLGCLHVPNVAPCDDGNLCTTGDICALGTCTGVPVVCVDANLCDGVDTCDPGTGACVTGPAPNCDDGNPCTDDACDALLGCMNTPNLLTCDDGNACTTLDTCVLGTCVGVPSVICTDLDACNGLETCNPATGVCEAGTAPNCDDGDPCTTDSCDSLLGCLHVPDPLCILTTLVAETRTADATEVRGTVRRSQLRRLTKMARKRYMRALALDPTVSPARFVRTDSAVVHFGDVVASGAEREKIAADAAQRWMRGAHTVHEILTAGQGTTP